VQREHDRDTLAGQRAQDRRRELVVDVVEVGDIGDSKSISDTNVSASAVWVLSGWAMPQKPTMWPVFAWSAAVSSM
jgi:hypothetical protein